MFAFMQNLQDIMFVFMENLQDITHFPIDWDTTAERGFITTVAIHARPASARHQRRNVYADKISQQTTCTK